MTDARYQTGLSGGMIETWAAVFRRQKAFAEHAFNQLNDERFVQVPAPGLNSVAIITRHLAGNLNSRFTDFLTTDGEKPWRDRDAELAPIDIPQDSGALASLRADVMQQWETGWQMLLELLDSLTNEDLCKTVPIRGAPHAVHAAIIRQLDHYAFHVGQINVIARLLVGTEHWQWLTIPPGGSAAFNEQMRSSPDA